MIRTAEDVKYAKKQLGLTVSEIADALRLSPASGATTVRSWMSGKREISGPAAVALEAMLAGFQPELLDYYDDDDGYGLYD